MKENSFLLCMKTKSMLSQQVFSSATTAMSSFRMRVEMPFPRPEPIKGYVLVFHRCRTPKPPNQMLHVLIIMAPAIDNHTSQSPQNVAQTQAGYWQEGCRTHQYFW